MFFLLVRRFFPTHSFKLYFILQEVFTAFHKDEEKLKKYLKIYQIGKINKPLNETTIDDDLIKKREEMKNDFENLRKLAIEMDLFKPNVLFYMLHLIHILFFNVMAYYIILTCEPTIYSFMASLFCHIIVQVIH
jgi:hypothetical protein